MRIGNEKSASRKRSAFGADFGRMTDKLEIEDGWTRWSHDDFDRRNGSGHRGNVNILRDSLVVVSVPRKSPLEGRNPNEKRLLSISG